MVDPVVNQEGQTYERYAIQEWYRHNHKDPLTNKRVKHKKLTPNLALYRIIQSFVENTELVCPKTNKFGDN